MSFWKSVGSVFASAASSIAGNIPFVGSIASGIIDAGADALGVGPNSAAEDAMKEQRRYNEALTAQARAYQTAEREAQNQWNLEQWQRENAEYDRRTADERAYNTPQAQAQRAAQAGLNPLAVLGQGSASDQTFAAPQAAPSSSPHPAPQPIPAQSYVDVLSKLSESRLDDANAERVQQMLGDELANMRADTVGKQLANIGQDLDNLFKHNSHGLRLDKMSMEIALLRATIPNMEEDTRLKAQEKLTKLSEEFLNYAKQWLTDEEYLVLVQKYEQLKQLFPLEQEEIRSRTAANRAQAARDNSQARLNSAEASLSELRLATEKDPAVQEARKQEVIAAVEKLKADKVLTDKKAAELEQLVIRLKKSNDWYEVDKIFGMLDRVAGRVIDGYRALTFQSIAEGRHTQEQWERDHYGDTTETVTFDGYDPVSKKHKTQTYSHRRSPK